jgi:hypothetical protein
MKRADEWSGVVLVTALALLLAGYGSVRAGVITGQVWENAQSSAENATIANQPNRPADATFTTTNINYQSQVSGYTLAAFLNNPVFTNTSGTFNPNGNLDNVYILLTGQTFLNAGANTFVVAHDDGVELNFPALPGLSGLPPGDYVDRPGGTSEDFTPFTVTAPSAGFYSFTLSYGEAFGPPGDLVFQINNGPVGSVPEPTSLALFGMTLAGAGYFGWRRRKQAATA